MSHGLVERGHLLIQESSLGLVSLCSGHSQQLMATLVLMDSIVVQPGERGRGRTGRREGIRRRERERVKSVDQIQRNISVIFLYIVLHEFFGQLDSYKVGTSVLQPPKTLIPRHYGIEGFMADFSLAAVSLERSTGMFLRSLWWQR